MALNWSHELHHNFPKIAEDSGFNFNTYKSKGYIDWAKIRQLDIDNLIRDRRFGLLEQYVGEIVGCALELEFDVRILDEGVVKLFRLAQLAVEYHQFCRRYLDQSVYVLREEIMAVTQELNILKRELREKEDELKRARRKCRPNIRPLPYNGNENIANMILKTLSCRGEIFPTAPVTDHSHQYNRCNYCDKVFMNQLYLKSHMNRRHSEIAERDVPVTNDNNQDHKTLNEEIMALKIKLHEMETMIENKIDMEKNIVKSNDNEANTQSEKSNEQVPNVVVANPEMKSVEVSTNNEDYFLSQIEKWKLEEREKYENELRELKQQIFETVNVLKSQKVEQTNSNDLQKLHDIIKEQGNQILTLKQELAKQHLKSETITIEKSSELESEMRTWMQKTEFQSKQLEILMNSLNEATKEAREARAFAESESERAAKLQLMLERSQSDKNIVNTGQENSVKLELHNSQEKEKHKPKTSVLRKDTQLLEELQQKANELLNVESSVSSEHSSSDSSEDLPANFVIRHSKKESDSERKETKSDILKEMKTELLNGKLLPRVKINKEKPQKVNHIHLKESDTSSRSHVTTSPKRLVRVKLTEEVNNRLVDIGVDPLKSGLNQNAYNKQRNQLQKYQTMKSKNNQIYEKTRHALIAYLDTRVTINKHDDRNKKVSPNKTMISISNVISNVKTKALSLVKQSDSNKGVQKVDIIKRGPQILRTSTSSEAESPERQSSNKKNIESNKKLKNRTLKVSRNKFTSEHHIDDDIVPMAETKSIENLIKSPVRKPNNTRQNILPKFNIAEPEHGSLFDKFPIEVKVDGIEEGNLTQQSDTSEDIEPDHQIPLKKNLSEDNVHMTLKQAKGVLKNASSTSSLNKKKVLFDMDAIQMKSVSASPSQSTSVGDSEHYELGLVNLDDEWDISSIHESLKLTPSKHVQYKISPKIAELKESIESQLVRRTETISTAPIGGVDITKALGGSNTSLGSSLLDDEQVPVAAPRTLTNKNKSPTLDSSKDIDDSDLDVSEYSLDVLKK